MRGEAQHEQAVYTREYTVIGTVEYTLEYRLEYTRFGRNTHVRQWEATQDDEGQSLRPESSVGAR